MRDFAPFHSLLLVSSLTTEVALHTHTATNLRDSSHRFVVMKNSSSETSDLCHYLNMPS
jgi:hypothetical protein